MIFLNCQDFKFLRENAENGNEESGHDRPGRRQGDHFAVGENRVEQGTDDASQASA